MNQHERAYLLTRCLRLEARLIKLREERDHWYARSDAHAAAQRRYKARQKARNSLKARTV